MSVKMVVKDISFNNSRGQKLVGVLRYSEPVEPTKYPVVIVLHGFASHKHHDLTADIANNLVHYGFLTLRFDFHGHGDSDGEFEEHTIHQQVDDVFAALDFVSELQYADKDRIALVGTDIGGNIALLAAENDARIKAVVAQGARSHFDNHINSWLHPHDLKELMTKGFFAHNQFNIRKEYVHSARQHDVLESLRNVYCPVLLVHGEADMRVRIEETRQMFLAANDPKVIEEVAGADHWFRGTETRNKLIDLCAQWFRRWVR
ncbi:alpha/beta fold hydrolase [Candidatus Woesearchaeota archaeon]|nr:alpha/beta fold hydrolase [Candidatus Woesearchaeota archaeon]